MRYSGLALCAVGVSASTISRIVHEKRAELESRHGWIKRDVEEQNAVIEARVGLKQMNLELANDHIMDMCVRIMNSNIGSQAHHRNLSLDLTHIPTTMESSGLGNR